MVAFGAPGRFRQGVSGCLMWNPCARTLFTERFSDRKDAIGDIQGRALADATEANDGTGKGGQIID